MIDLTVTLLLRYSRSRQDIYIYNVTCEGKRDNFPEGGGKTFVQYNAGGTISVSSKRNTTKLVN